MSPPSYRSRDVLPTLVIVIYFLYLVWPAMHDYLNPDDSMNLYLAGLALYIAAATRHCCVFLESSTRNLTWRSRYVRDAMLFLVLLITIFLHVRQRQLVVARGLAPGGEDQVRGLSEDVLRLYSTLRANTRLLLINDAFGDEPGSRCSLSS